MTEITYIPRAHAYQASFALAYLGRPSDQPKASGRPCCRWGRRGLATRVPASSWEASQAPSRSQGSAPSCACSGRRRRPGGAHSSTTYTHSGFAILKSLIPSFLSFPLPQGEQRFALGPATPDPWACACALVHMSRANRQLLLSRQLTS